MTIYEQIYKKLQEIGVTDKLLNREGEAAAKSKVDSFMDLNFDLLLSEFDTDTKEILHHDMALSHYYKMNGDMVADPDMVIRIYPARKMAEAMTYQDFFGYKVVYNPNGSYSPQQKKSQNAFLLQWLNNLIIQEHSFEEGF